MDERIRLLVAGILIAASPVIGRAATLGDARDQPYLSTIVNQALETERTKVEIPWSNPETSNRGVIVIDRTWYRDPQSPCRDYRWTLQRQGHPTETISGTGCRIGPAVWRLDERSTPATSPSSPPPPIPVTPPAGPTQASDPDASATAPSAGPVTPAATASSASPPARTARAEPARQGPKAAKPKAASPPTVKPASLPDYTLPSKTAM